MLLALIAVLLQASAGPDQPQAAPASEILGPKWLKRPTGEDINRLYPKDAYRRGISGRATISCSVTGEGTLTGCQVLEEAPLEEGFGDAALRMAPSFKMQALTPQGQTVAGGTVKIPIRFHIDNQIDPLSAMLGCYGVTAAAAQKEPTNGEASRAYAFFAAQVAFRETEARASPETFETNLSAARRGAEAGISLPGTPILRQCLDVAAKAAK
ncbi:energy transducer TonB [Phenylobacterium sp.]|uniref:energy transducer TonB n=1 Tax=Phenylobacterium sp. TaxID=1871053 RepID=UPI0025F8634C|nr:energy transducer TonB [Phenylobacterium sp.]